MVKEEKGYLLHGTGSRGKAALQIIVCHLQDTDMNLRFK
jgi:hypothetical protein